MECSLCTTFNHSVVISMPFCPECGKPVAQNAKFCRNCGTSQLDDAQTIPVSTTVAAPATVVSPPHNLISLVRFPDACGSAGSAIGLQFVRQPHLSFREVLRYLWVKRRANCSFDLPRTVPATSAGYGRVCRSPDLQSLWERNQTR